MYEAWLEFPEGWGACGEIPSVGEVWIIFATTQWSHHTILSTDSKVRVTLQNSIKHSGSERVQIDWTPWSPHNSSVTFFGHSRMQSLLYGRHFKCYLQQCLPLIETDDCYIIYLQVFYHWETRSQSSNVVSGRQGTQGLVLLGILSGGVLPSSPNSDAILDQKMSFFTLIFRPGL